MGNIAIFGAPNLVQPLWVTPGALDQASTSFATSNLGTDEPSESWRSASANPFATMLFAFRDLNGIYPSFGGFDGVGLVGVNLSRAAKLRILGGTGDPAGSGSPSVSLDGSQRVPTSLEASANITGTFTDVDEGLQFSIPGPSSADGNRIAAATANLPWNARFGFATPGTAPRTGADMQAFVAHVTLSGALDSEQIAPTMTCELYESGALVRNLGTKYVTESAAGGQYLIWSWDAAELATASGANVELRLSSTPADDGSGYKTVRLERCAWMVDTTDQMTGVSVDTGWFSPSADPSPALWGDFIADDEQPQQSIVHLLASEAGTIQSLWVLVRDDQAPTDADPLLERLRVPDGYVEVGRLVIGKVFRPTYNIEWGDLLGVIDLSEVNVTDGGQTFGQKKARLRTLSLPLNWLTQVEAVALFDRLLWRKGRLSPVLISAIPDSATETRHTTIWARLDGASALATRQAFDSTGSLRGLSLNFVEVV